MSATAVIQARTASSRLPGKVLLPLDGMPVIKHIVRRAQSASSVDNVIVATTFHTRDDLIEEYAEDAGALVYRGSEDDVLGRLTEAVSMTDNEVTVRITGDNPFVCPELIDVAVRRLQENNLDYTSNKLNRTFPIGVDAEAITSECFVKMEVKTNNAYYREHATQYIRDHPDKFRMLNIETTDVYEPGVLTVGPELRLTLDEPDDYRLYRTVYNQIEYTNILNVVEAINYIIENDLYEINSAVNQETL